MDKNFEEKKMKIEEYLSFLRQVLFAKSAVVPVISSLSIAALVLATLNPELVPLTTGVRWAIVILLLMVVLPIWAYLVEISFTMKNITKSMENILEKKISLPAKKGIEKWLGTSIFFAPYFFLSILTSVIFYFIFLILHSSL